MAALCPPGAPPVLTTPVLLTNLRAHLSSQLRWQWQVQRCYGSLFDLSWASVDRKDPDGDYTLRNHRWMHKGGNFFKNECKYDRFIRQ